MYNFLTLHQWDLAYQAKLEATRFCYLLASLARNCRIKHAFD